MKQVKKHIGYYLSLFFIFLIGTLLTVSLAPNLNLQKIVVFLTIVAYVVWGIVHHYINHELTKRIVIEYVLIGLFGLSILFFIVEGGGV